ncbi:hypothetical protein V3481_018638 [Fusarium oxysporum f. sp. vasinfectum]
MDPKYKPILSRPSRPSSSIPASSTPIQIEETDSQKRRRSQKHIACERCRKKKISCNGTKPNCPPCMRANAECVYRQYRNTRHQEQEELLGLLNSSEQRHQAQSNVINLLRSLPMDQATEMLRQLRESNDLSTALSSIQENSSLTIQPSNIRNARAISPPTGSATEFELAAQFSTAYPSISPHDIQVLRGLLRQDNDDETRTVQKNTPLPLPSTSQDSGQTRELEKPGLQKYCDSCLERLQIGYWTKIPISDDFAASLISFYINNDHKIMGFFDADLFLGDLVERRQRFCSSFLVSVVLYMACQGYTAIDTHANEVRIEAFHEAEMLWQGEI